MSKPFNPLLSLMFLVSLSLSAQTELDYNFHHFDPTNGFPADVVYNIEFDADGALWALTEKGLMRYNGHSGRIYPFTDDSTGLLNFKPHTLYLDQYGKLWIGYQREAISSFDPQTEKFEHFKHNPTDITTFPGAMASSFFEDNRGNFWIGTWGGGMCRLDLTNKKFKRIVADEDDSTALQTTSVTHIAQKDRDELIISSWEGDGFNNFLSFYNLTTEKFTKFPLGEYQAENEIESIKLKQAFRIVHFVESDEKGNWWVGTYTGLFYVNHQDKTILRITGLNKDLLNSGGHITFDNVRSMIYESDEIIWFATEVDGIMVYDKSNNHVGYIRRDVNDPSSLSGNIIRDIEKDQYGNMWVATRGGGIDVYCPVEEQVKIISNSQLQAERMHVAQGLFAINYMLVTHDNQNILIAHGNGMSVYNMESGETYRVEIREPFMQAMKQNPALEEFNFNNPNFVGVIHEMNNAYVIGTYCGLVAYYPSTGKLDFSTLSRFVGWTPEAYNGHDEILALVRNSEQAKMTDNTTAAHISILNTKTWQHKPIFNLSHKIATGEEAGYGTFESIDSLHFFLLASANSFMIYDHEKQKIETYSCLDPYKNFPDSAIYLLHIDHYGVVWLRGANGLYAFDYSSGEITNIIQDLALKKDDQIRCLTRDQQGILWIALANDLVRYNPSTKESFRFNKRHGFDAGGFTDRFIRRHQREEVIIPANYGLLMFNPKRVQYHSEPPNIYISSVAIGKDTMTTAGTREFVSSKQDLMWTQNFITIEFASDLLYAPGGKSYQYRLVGLDSSWITTNQQNSVTYTNLEPGDYNFQVRCIDGYGNASATIAVPFFIDTAFWWKWWFILLEIIFAMALVYAFVYYRERRLKYDKMKLELAVDFRTREVKEKVVEIEAQKAIIEEKNKEVTASITYAKNIQTSLLAHDEFLDDHLPEYTIFFKPKDIVSGDFYWATKTEAGFYMAVCDSTGHGVPGAFMSLLNIRYLNEAIVEKQIASPNLALDYVRNKLVDNLAVDGNKDGMDGTLIRFDTEEKRIIYASAQNHPLLIRDGKPQYLPADKMPVGGGYFTESFQPRMIELIEGDVLYFFTDGYPDQFGGPKGGKLKHANLIKFFESIHHLPMHVQEEKMEEHFLSWKGDLEQLDDVLVFAFRV